MRSNSRRAWVASLAFAVILAVVAGPTAAKKPPKPSPDPDPGLTDPALACIHVGNSQELRVMTADGTGSLKLYSQKKGKLSQPTWSPDGSRIAFLAFSGDSSVFNDLYTVKPDGTGLTLVRSFSTTNPYPPERMDMSPDGSQIVYAGGGALWALEVATGDVDKLLTPDLDDGYGMSDVSCGPDLDPASGYQGWIVFLQGEIHVVKVTTGTSGTLEVVGDPVAFTRTGTQRHPTWSPDGTLIAFEDQGGTSSAALVMVPVVTDSGGGILSFGTPQTIHSGRYNYAAPTWAPAGGGLAFQSVSRWLSGGGATADLYHVTLSGALTELTDGADRDSDREVDWNPAWTENT